MLVYLGFGLGAFFIVLGVLTLAGYIFPNNSLEQINQLKWIFGVVLILWGTYRVIDSYIKFTKIRREKNENITSESE